MKKAFVIASLTLLTLTSMLIYAVTPRIEDSVFLLVTGADALARGTGFAIDMGNGVKRVLTAAHVCTNEHEKKATLWGISNDVASHPLTIIKMRVLPQLDVCEMAPVEGIPTLKLAKDIKVDGEMVCLYGHHRGKAIHKLCGPTLRVELFHSDTSVTREVGVVVDFPAEHGDSGSPVVNAQGEVVGVVSALREENGRIVTFIAPLVAPRKQ